MRHWDRDRDRKNERERERERDKQSNKQSHKGESPGKKERVKFKDYLYEESMARVARAAHAALFEQLPTPELLVRYWTLQVSVCMMLGQDLSWGTQWCNHVPRKALRPCGEQLSHNMHHAWHCCRSPVVKRDKQDGRPYGAGCDHSQWPCDMQEGRCCKYDTGWNTRHLGYTHSGDCATYFARDSARLSKPSTRNTAPPAVNVGAHPFLFPSYILPLGRWARQPSDGYLASCLTSPCRPISRAIWHVGKSVHVARTK